MTGPDPEADRVRREETEVEAAGAKWALRTDEFLVGYVSGQRPGHFHTPAIVEMQRRHMAAMKQFNEQTAVQTQYMLILTEKMERLTRGMFWLTIAVGVVALLQLWAAIGGTTR